MVKGFEISEDKGSNNPKFSGRIRGILGTYAPSGQDEYTHHGGVYKLWRMRESHERSYKGFVISKDGAVPTPKTSQECFWQPYGTSTDIGPGHLEFRMAAADDPFKSEGVILRFRESSHKTPDVSTTLEPEPDDTMYETTCKTLKKMGQKLFADCQQPFKNGRQNMIDMLAEESKKEGFWLIVVIALLWIIFASTFAWALVYMWRQLDKQSEGIGIMQEVLGSTLDSSLPSENSLSGSISDGGLNG